MNFGHWCCISFGTASFTRGKSGVPRGDLIASGFTISEEKSNWNPRLEVCFLGYILNFESGMIYVSERRMDKLKSSLANSASANSIRIRTLASIVGQIISMGTAVGNIVRLMTRHCYCAIGNRSFWDQVVPIFPGVREELLFWSSNVNSLNGKFMSPKSSTVGIVYSDASDSGFGGYLVQCGKETVDQMSGSSTLREILAVKFVLLSLVSKLSGSSIKWFTDNQNVPRILTCGSGKTLLQSEALDIYHIFVNNGISIEMEWIPCNENDEGYLFISAFRNR